MTHSPFTHTSKPSLLQVRQALLAARVNTNHPGSLQMRQTSSSKSPNDDVTPTAPVKRKAPSTPVINLVDDDEEEDAWDALDEIEGRVGAKSDEALGAG
jgi:hypothetical protein